MFNEVERSIEAGESKDKFIRGRKNWIGNIIENINEL